MNTLEIKNIWRSYGSDRVALKGLDLTVTPGEVIGFLGRNGAGKTTLLRTTMGLLLPHRGSVRVFGLDPFQQPVEVKRRVGYVPETQALPEHLRVRDVMSLYRSLFPTWDVDFEKHLRQRFALDEWQGIANLSKGQARQVALLCAVAHRPELLILDEPGAGLDPAARREFLEVALTLLNEQGSTILFSSHHTADVERIAERVVLIDQGQILLDCDLDELREAYCVAVLSRCQQGDDVRILALEGCLRVREQGERIHAVFASPVEVVEELLARELGVRDARCTRVVLEDLFIELLGTQS